MRTALCLLVLCSLSSLASGARAEGPTAAVKTKADGVRRDPQGVRGISPYWEALKKGDGAFIARDFDAAIAAYKEAITAQPHNAVGHYRVGEAQVAKGDLAEAESAFSAGLRFVDKNDSLKAKLQFALADLAERKKAYEDASTKWTEYETFTTATPDAHGYPASATERKKVIETWKKVSADAAAVKARIEKRLKEAEEAIRKSSK